MFFISYISITCIHIYSYIFHISVNFFLICQDRYFDINALYIKFFNNFSLPDVVCAVIVLYDMISLLVSIGVMVTEDDELNKVDFVVIDICGKLTETLY